MFDFALQHFSVPLLSIVPLGDRNISLIMIFDGVKDGLVYILAILDFARQRAMWTGS
jgi:hypothetical protein